MGTSARNKLKQPLWGYLPMKIVMYHQHVIVHQKSGTYVDIHIFIRTFTVHLKVGLSPFKKNCFICFNENLLQMMKNAFDFILKALFVHKIFKF